MNLGFTKPIEQVLSDIDYTNDRRTGGWNFSMLDKSIIRFKPFGIIDSSNYPKLSDGFDRLQSIYFSKYKFLILIFDFTDFKKADSVVRTKILEGRVFRNENIRIVVFGLNYFVSTMAKVISRKQIRKRLFIVKDEITSLETANKLIINFNSLSNSEADLTHSDSSLEKTIEIGGKSYELISKQAWTYHDPTGDYFYKIDLIDKTIFISRPSGYIRYQNSVMANVLFDKVVNKTLQKNEKYYRIQDYSSVNGSENKARRDFTNYITNGIDKINMVVFFGLNRTMKTVVRLGKLVNPNFEKIQIANTFEEALTLVINHKYSITAPKKNLKSPLVKKHSLEKEIKDLREKQDVLLKENIDYSKLLFERISKISFGSNEENVSAVVDETNPFNELFSAVQLLEEDFKELMDDRNQLKLKLKLLYKEHAEELKALKIGNLARLREKDNLILNSGQELGSTLMTVLNAIQLLDEEKQTDSKKPLLDIISRSSKVIRDSIEQLKLNIADIYTVDTVNESIFDYRENIIQVIEAARMGYTNNNVIFENRIDEGIPQFLIGDKRKFNQLVNVLMENSLKFTNDGFIKIHNELIETNASQARIRISVEDSGIGIDTKVQERIFKDENIEDNYTLTDRKGFGLLIAKNIAHILDAEIGFESEIGLGSKFWFELTFNNGYNDKADKTIKVPSHNIGIDEKLTSVNLKSALLIIEDISRASLLARILEQKNIKPRIKLNQECYEAIHGPFDYMFVSLILDGVEEENRLTTIKNTLQAKGENKNIMIIGMVDSLIDPILEDYKKMGVTHFISNNYKLDEIDKLIEKLK